MMPRRGWLRVSYRTVAGTTAKAGARSGAAAAAVATAGQQLAPDESPAHVHGGAVSEPPRSGHGRWPPLVSLTHLEAAAAGTTSRSRRHRDRGHCFRRCKIGALVANALAAAAALRGTRGTGHKKRQRLYYSVQWRVGWRRPKSTLEMFPPAG